MYVRKNNRQLCLYDIADELKCVDYAITGIDKGHDEDTVKIKNLSQFISCYWPHQKISGFRILYSLFVI